MTKRILLLLSAVSVLFVGSVFLLREFRSPGPVTAISDTSLKQFELLSDDEEPSREITREVLLSSPLIIFGRGSATPFTPSAVISETNRQRVLAGLPPLAENDLLDRAAELKVQDLFEKQYFDHVSPTGDGPDALARRVGYEYVSIGENLALGTFGDEGALIDAWMKSPGHRANILRSQFQEIGLAVGRGDFNGRQVLIAVQEFGRPIASCPAVSVLLKQGITTQRAQLSILSKTLESLRQEIDQLSSSSTVDALIYQNKVMVYNGQVTEYNKMVTMVKEKTTLYNSQVRTFNTCLRSST